MKRLWCCLGLLACDDGGGAPASTDAAAIDAAMVDAGIDMAGPDATPAVPGWRPVIADNAVDIHAGRLIVLNAAWNMDRGADLRHLASVAKLHASEMLGRVADRSIQVLGGLGFTCDTPLEKIYRTARGGRIYDGPSEVHRYVIARNILKGHVRESKGLAVEA